MYRTKVFFPCALPCSVCCRIICRSMQGPIKSLVLLWEQENFVGSHPMLRMCTKVKVYVCARRMVFGPPSDAVKCVLSLAQAPSARSWIPDRQTKGALESGWSGGCCWGLGTRAGTLRKTRYRAEPKRTDWVHVCLCMCVCACVYVRVGLQADKLAARHGLCSAFVCTCNAIICIAIVCSILSLSGCLCIIILLLLASLLLSQRAKGIITQ